MCDNKNPGHRSYAFLMNRRQLVQWFPTFWYSRTPESKIVSKLDYFSHKLWYIAYPLLTAHVPLGLRVLPVENGSTGQLASFALRAEEKR